MAAIELYTPQGAKKVSGMIYAPDEQGLALSDRTLSTVQSILPFLALE